MNSQGMDRRSFLKTTALCTASGIVTLSSRNAFAGMMGGGGGGGMGGSGVVDPPVGASFQDPPELILTRTFENSRNVFTADIEVGETLVDVNGTRVNLMTYNNSFPGPTITIPQGDILRVRLTNQLTDLSTNLLGHQRGVTNLHSHGWHVSPKALAPNSVPPVYSDYVMYSLEPGKMAIHEYDTSREQASGFHFYHPHLHGLSAEQYWAGLVGALVTKDNLSVLSGIETHIMVLKDLSVVGSEPAPHDTMMDYMHGKEGDLIMVNGQVNPALSIRPGQVQRWRILNASNARFYKLSLTNHTMYLVGTDGRLLDKPYGRSQILLSPGERVDVLVKASSTPGDYKLLSMPYSRMGMMSSSQITLLTMRIQGPSISGSIPSTIDPNARRLTIDTSKLVQRTLDLSMAQGQGYINGISFESMDNCFSFTSTMIPSYEVWTVTNSSGMDHPFHQHVDHAQVLSISGADSAYPPYASMPAWKDVVMIPKWSSAKLLVPVTDFDGMTMIHCHILEHEDIGMMGTWMRGMSM